MHKGIILLTEATSKDEAISNVKDFLEPYGNGNVWDWYVIGGRWNNQLAPKITEFSKIAEGIINPKKEQFVSQKAIDESQILLQIEWEKLGMTGKNPYCNHYNLESNGNTYDVLPLVQCIDVVKTWLKDLKQTAKEYWKRMNKAKEKAIKGEYDMSGYYAKRYAEANGEEFCFDSNVYDITKYEAEKLPNNIEDYYAVMVDLHN